MILHEMIIRSLYISYFGVREPLVQTQVLPYLRQLAAADLKVNLLTFEPRLEEKWSDDELASQRAQLAAQGIGWFYLPYHKTPTLPATLYDIAAGARFALKLARREGIDVLHARAHVPMAMALLARRFMAFKLVFDIRGLMAEEYADAAIWTEGSLPFRLVKSLERAGIRCADQIVVLTERFRDWLLAHRLKSPDQIEVIPCCVDIERFDGEHSIDLDHGSRPSDRFEVVYAGSLVGLYLVEEMGHFFREIKKQRPDAFLRILSVSPREQGVEALRRAGVDETDYEIQAVAPSDVPAYLRQARIGLSFRKPTFAQIAASPTKISEYLAAGLPVVCNTGIGDVDELVERERVGVVVRQFDEDAYQRAAEEAIVIAEDPDIRRRCRCVARSNFDLHTIGGQRYLNVYRRLAQR
jgi:glycosyltransferase involved in cell wall biosynthesis